eukprot:sb/3476935/
MRKGEEVEVDGGEGRRRGVVGIPGDGAILNISYPEGPAIPILLDEVTSFAVTAEGPDGTHAISLDVFGGRSLVLHKTENPESVKLLSGLRKVLRMSAKPSHQRAGPTGNDAS